MVFIYFTLFFLICKEYYNKNVDYFEKNNIKLNEDVYVRVSFQGKRGNNFNLKEEYDGK